MRRRDFVKGILAAGAAAKTMNAQQQAAPAPPAAPPPVAQSLPPHAPIPPGPTPWMSGLMEVKPLDLNTLVPDAVAQTEAHFFNAQQRLTLRRLCEVLMPPLKGFPGALDVGVPEFLDFLIGASPRPRQQMYLRGLDWLDEQAHGKYSQAFAKTTDAQAEALIKPWLRTWMSDFPPKEANARFINIAHHEIREATANSQAWSDAKSAASGEPAGLDLYWFPVDPNLNREPETQAHKAPVAAAHV